MDYNYFKIIYKRVFVLSIVLFISIFNLSFAADNNLCPGQAVNITKYYENIEGECSVSIYNGSTLLGTLNKSTGTINITSNNITGVALTDSTTTLASPNATATLRFYNFPYLNTDINLILTCVRPNIYGASSTTTATTSINVTNYGGTDPNFSGKKCIDNSSVYASTSKGISSNNYNNNYGNNYVLDPFSGNERCSNGSSGPKPYLDYNTGATTDGGLPCTSFTPTPKIFVYNNVPTNIQYTCQQSDKYTLYFVPNKTVLEANSLGWGTPVIATTTIDTTYKSPTRPFYFDGAWTPASKGAVRLVCSKGATSTPTTFDFGAPLPNKNTLASITCSKSGLVRLFPNCASPGDQYAFSTSSLNFVTFLPFTNGTYYNVTASSTYYLRCQYSGNSAENFSIASIYAGPSGCDSTSTTVINPTTPGTTPTTPTSPSCYVGVYQDATSTEDLLPAAPASSTNALFKFVLNTATTSCSCSITGNGVSTSIDNNSTSYSTSTSVSTTTNAYNFNTIKSVPTSPQCYFSNTGYGEFAYTQKPILIKLSANPNTIYYYASTTLYYSIDNNGSPGATCRISSTDNGFNLMYSNWATTSSFANDYLNPLKGTISTNKIKDPASFTMTCGGSSKKVNVNLYTRGDI